MKKKTNKKKNKVMKKLIFLITIVAITLVSCDMPHDTVIKTKTQPGYIEREYVLDTLDNGHILMHDKGTREYGLIEYPECPKCEENLKKIITEVLDSITKERNKEVVDKLNSSSTSDSSYDIF